MDVELLNPGVIMNLKTLSACFILTFLLDIGNIKAQSFFQDSIEIEKFIQVEFCGPDYGERDSLTVDVTNPETLEMLLDNGLYNCFTGYEDEFPILSFLSRHIYAIETELIISRIKSNEEDRMLYLALLESKLKSISNPDEIILFAEDFDHLNQHDLVMFRDILYASSIKLK